MLQSEEIFLNVTSGTRASKKHLQKLFPGKKREDIVALILKHGQYTINELERNVSQETLLSEVIEFVREKTLNPETGQIYPPEIISKAMEKLHLSVEMNLNAKRNGLRIIKLLTESNVINLCRIKMQLKITLLGNYSRCC